MARLRPRGTLNCFYCGKRSSLKFDGVIRDFLCLYCDATNYLDQNGDITDPPVAKTSSSEPTAQYAVPRSRPSTRSTASSNIPFCDTCLKNQHLFTSSLAQYLPSDTSHPDYAQREKDYYKFRRGLEQRYPQICADCEPKALAQVDQAGYTARTDHLRRMMDKSRQQRVMPRQRTMLDVIASLGRWLWLSSFVFQFLWHVASVAELAGTSQASESLRDPDETVSMVARVTALAANILPNALLLIRMSIWANVGSLWWNPKFVQVYRGFTKHILGLSQWYSFQMLCLVIRIAGSRSAAYAELQPSARLSLHGLLGFAMIMFYTIARHSVRTDTTPLFQPRTHSMSPASSPPKASTAIGGNPTNNMSNMLDEMLNEPSAPAIMDPSPPSTPFTSSPNPFARRQSPQTQSVSHEPLQMSSLGLGDQPAPVEYSDEMDWTPTQSKHRAFNNFSGSSQGRSFNEPDLPAANPFRTKVPPAPVMPSQRAYTTTPKPEPISSTPSRSPMFFSTTHRPAKTRGNTSTTSAYCTQKGEESHSSLSLAEPHFFAATKTNQHDPRSSLADLLNTSFSLGQDEPEPSEETRGTNRNVELKLRQSVDNSANQAGLINLSLLAILIGSWIHSTSAEWHESKRDIMLGCMALAAMCSVSMVAASLKRLHASRVPYPALVARACFAVVQGLGGLGLALQIWGALDESEALSSTSTGTFLLGSMFTVELVSFAWHLIAS